LVYLEILDIDKYDVETPTAGVSVPTLQLCVHCITTTAFLFKKNCPFTRYKVHLGIIPENTMTGNS